MFSAVRLCTMCFGRVPAEPVEETEGDVALLQADTESDPTDTVEEATEEQNITDPTESDEQATTAEEQ